MKWWPLVVPALVFVSCKGSDQCSGKQVTCPSFDDNLALLWSPYKANQIIIFNSATTGRDTLIFSNVSLSESYQENATAGQPDCSAVADFNTGIDAVNTSPKFQETVNLNHDQFTGTELFQTHFQIKGGFFQGAGFADTGLVKSNELSISQFYISKAIGNKTFANVQEVVMDTIKTSLTSDKVYKFWMARNVGIVAFQELGGDLWVKQ